MLRSHVAFVPSRLSFSAESSSASALVLCRAPAYTSICVLPGAQALSLRLLLQANEIRREALHLTTLVPLSFRFHAHQAHAPGAVSWESRASSAAHHGDAREHGVQWQDRPHTYRHTHPRSPTTTYTHPHTPTHVHQAHATGAVSWESRASSAAPWRCT